VKGGEVRGFFVLVDVGYYHFPMGTGYLANVPFLMQTWILPALENEPYASVLMHG